MERMLFLGTFGVIREAVRIGIRNPSFILLTIIFSLPSFFISFLHELLLQHILGEAALSPQLRDLPPNSNSNSNSIAVTRLAEIMSGRVLVLGLLYLIPTQLSNLLTAVTTVHSASAIYAGLRPVVGLRDLLHSSITKTRWKGPFVTCIYKLLLSNISALVVIFILLGTLLLSRDLLFLLASVMGAIIALGVWLVLSAWWNMAVVISILENKGGLQALSTSNYLSKGNRVRGFALMFLDLIWLYWLSWSTLHVRSSFSGGVVLAFVNTGLLCLGKVMKWITCMVYYHDCKRRCRNWEKVDMEQGREDELLTSSRYNISEV